MISSLIELIVTSWLFNEVLALLSDDCKVVLCKFNLSFSCLKKAIVFSLAFELLNLKAASSLLILSFSCFKRAIVLSCPETLLVYLREDLSI